MASFDRYVEHVAKSHFTQVCIALAQSMHRTEARLRQNLLPASEHYKIRPLNDAKAIANGANAISEGFLFLVAISIIIGETYRGSRNRANERDGFRDEINQLREQLEKMSQHVQEDTVTEGNSLVASQSPSLPNSGTFNNSQYIQLANATKLLCTIAEKKGWFGDETQLPSELKWLLESKDMTSDSPSNARTPPSHVSQSPSEYAQSTVKSISDDIQKTLNVQFKDQKNAGVSEMSISLPIISTFVTMIASRVKQTTNSFFAAFFTSTSTSICAA